MQALGTISRFMTHLREPWDAAWLAKNYPDAFELKSDILGIVEITDLTEAFRLTEADKVFVIDDERGFLLSVNGIEQRIVPMK